MHGVIRFQGAKNLFTAFIFNCEWFIAETLLIIELSIRGYNFLSIRGFWFFFFKRRTKTHDEVRNIHETAPLLVVMQSHGTMNKKCMKTISS